VNRSNDVVRLRRQETEELMLALDRSALRTAYAVPESPQAGKGELGPIFGEGERTGVLRGFVRIIASYIQSLGLSLVRSRTREA